MGRSVQSHHGPVDTIPSTASPGLLFLQQFLPALDSLDPSVRRLVSSFLAPNATFTINGDVTPADATFPMFEMRSKHLSKFGHLVESAWDMEQSEEEEEEEEDDDKKGVRGQPRMGMRNKRGRTVMYESTSITVFKDDPDQVEVKVPEFNIIDLEEEEETCRLRATALRTYMDAKPVQERAMEIRRLAAQKGDGG